MCEGGCGGGGDYDDDKGSGSCVVEGCDGGGDGSVGGDRGNGGGCRVDIVVV